MTQSCPSCSTPVEINKKDDYVVCPYCGCLLEVDGDELEEYTIG